MAHDLAVGEDPISLAIGDELGDGRGRGLLAIASYLAADPRVEWLSYLRDPGFAYYELAQRYLKGHCPSIVTFGVAGGYDAGIRFFDSVRLFKRLVNVGDVKSPVAHPASTTPLTASCRAKR